VYDGIPGGIGFSEGLMSVAADWYDRVIEQLSSCGCEDGCPSCVFSTWCPSANDRLSRRNGLVVARFSSGL
jgi:DEAD/DEAH box helicase domain-containing protein